MPAVRNDLAMGRILAQSSRRRQMQKTGANSATADFRARDWGLRKSESVIAALAHGVYDRERKVC